MKSRIAIVFLVLLAVCLNFRGNTSAGTDDFNLSQATISGDSPADVASWASTATITNITLTPSVKVDFDKASGPDQWPDQRNLGVADISPDDPIQYTIWMFRKISGEWIGAGFIRVWQGAQLDLPLENAPCDWFYYVPEMLPGKALSPGEELGFMVTAGVERRGTFTTVRERSNVKVVKVPSGLPASHCDENNPGEGGSGGPGEGGSEPGAGAIPPAESSEVTALTGYNGQLAYSPLSKLWLVTSQTSNAIMGIMMNEKNKPVGTAFTIGAKMKQPFTPRVAYDEADNKFLVVWVDNAGQSIFYGQFISPTGALLGSNFQIASGKDLKIPENSHLVFDTKNNKFVFVYEINGGKQITLQTVHAAGTVDAPIKLNNPQGVQTMMADVAVSTTRDEYCVAYRWSGPSRSSNPKSSSIGLQTVNPTTGALGPELFASDDVFYFGGIAANTQDDSYFIVWQDANLKNLYTQTLNGCEGNEDDATSIAEKDGAASVTYNPASNTFAIITQDQATAKNNVYVVEAGSLQSVSSYSLFGGGGGNFQPYIAPNPITGTFAALSSQDRAQTKFVANIGWPEVTALVRPVSATNPHQQLSASTEGLPTDLGQFIGAIFTWSLRLIGLVIFIRFFWAGLLWFTAAGNSSKTKQATDIMKNAALGAVVLFAAYLILNTINPDLIKGTLNLPGINGESTTPTSTTTNPPTTATITMTSAKNLLSTLGVAKFSTTADCPNYHALGNIQDMASGKVPVVCSPTCACAAGGVSGTTSVNPAILNGLTTLSSQGASFLITSFTTGKHAANSAHYTGHAVDIIPASSNRMDWQKIRTQLKSIGGTPICEDSNTGQDVITCTGSNVDHIHWTY